MIPRNEGFNLIKDWACSFDAKINTSKSGLPIFIMLMIRLPSNVNPVGKTDSDCDTFAVMGIEERETEGGEVFFAFAIIFSF